MSDETIRSTSPGFASDCATFTTTATSYSDTELPPEGTSFFYLVRTLTPFTGSWGQDSSGAERVIACSTFGDDTGDGDGRRPPRWTMIRTGSICGDGSRR